MSYVHDAGVLVKIFVSEDDSYRGELLYEAILELAHNMHLAGVTAIRGFEGFGASTDIHSQRNYRISEDLPIMLNVIDKRGRLEPFINEVEAMLIDAKAQGFISISPCEMIHPGNL